MRTQKEIARKRTTRLKRRLQHTIEGSMAHVVANPHMDFKRTVSADVRRMMRRFSREEARRPGVDIDSWLLLSHEQTSLVAQKNEPFDWVLGKDGRYIWDENVSSATDGDLNGRTYIGAGKYDGWNHAYTNRTIIEKLFGFGPKNVDWNSYYQAVFANYALTLIKIQAKREMIPLSEEDKAFNLRNRQATDSFRIEPEKESFGRVNLSNAPKLKHKYSTETVKFTFKIPVGNGESIDATGSYQLVSKDRAYISQFRYAKYVDIYAQYARYTEYGFLFGNSSKNDIIVIQVNTMEDYKTLKTLLGSQN